jgi:hypothetical protein
VLAVPAAHSTHRLQARARSHRQLVMQPSLLQCHPQMSNLAACMMCLQRMAAKQIVLEQMSKHSICLAVTVVRQSLLHERHTAGFWCRCGLLLSRRSALCHPPCRWLFRAALRRSTDNTAEL